MIREAERVGFEAIVITADSPNYGRPYRELRNGYVIQNSFPPANALLSETFEPFTDPTFTWDDVAWVQRLTRLPVIIKGIFHPFDIAEAIRRNVAAVWVSNHGGRSFDTVPSTVSKTLSDLSKHYSW